MNTFYRLEGGVRHYAWGQRATAESVPMIAELLGEAAGDEPWAELWLGAHASLPSHVRMDDGALLPLDKAISAAPNEWLGGKAAAVKPQLAFLFKVLTCSSAL
ncbi:MAG: mannose-6-phosphate isomerase, class I, partial [Lentisphaeria bacterium]|nr:mannose-6-phosphate isomerase, class I [Lentisphaeria bacterium]